MKNNQIMQKRVYSKIFFICVMAKPLPSFISPYNSNFPDFLKLEKIVRFNEVKNQRSRIMANITIIAPIAKVINPNIEKLFPFSMRLLARLERIGFV